MSHALIVRPEADADLELARDWYEERMPGLGRQFVESVDAALASISQNPLAYPVIRKVTRRALVKRFPYGVFFLIEEDTVIVLAVLHQARNPESWAARA